VGVKKEAQVQAITQPPARRSIIQKIKDHYVISWIGVFMLFVGFVQFLATPFAAPEVHTTDSDPVSPFVFPFAVKNSSKLIPLENVEWTCLVRHMEVGGLTLNNVGIRTIGQESTIDAGDISNHICNVMNPGVPIRKLSMDVAVQYTMLYLWHRSSSQRFTWWTDGERSKWIEGDVR
jgi:hypothetical protein